MEQGDEGRIIVDIVILLVQCTVDIVVLLVQCTEGHVLVLTMVFQLVLHMLHMTEAGANV